MNTIPATVQVQVSEEYVNQKVEEKIAEFVKPRLILVTKKQLSVMFSMSENELEESFLTHPSVRLNERRKGERGKRRWLYEPTLAAIEQILDKEW